MTDLTQPATARTQPSPFELGVGMRFGLHPHADDFVPIILGALAEAGDASAGLTIRTGTVSTFVGPDEGTPDAEQRMASYLAAVVSAAVRLAPCCHLVVPVLLSRGCPGELRCALPGGTLPAAAPVAIAATGIAAVAEWSLYPLLDGGGTGSHMAPIEAAIADAGASGVVSGSAHFATELRGDLAEVLATAFDAWTRTGAEVPHVVSHLTVSIASPSEVGR